MTAAIINEMYTHPQSVRGNGSTVSDLYLFDLGGVLLFSCSLIHEALPITRGRRFALLNFVRQRSPCAPGSR